MLNVTGNCTDKAVLGEVLDATKLLKEEKKISSRNLALVLLHDLLLAKGIQASEGAVKQAVLRHKTRLHSEFTRIKIKRGVKSNAELAANGDERAGACFWYKLHPSRPTLWSSTFLRLDGHQCLLLALLTFTHVGCSAKIPRYVRVNTSCWTTREAIETFTARGYSLDGPFAHK